MLCTFRPTMMSNITMKSTVHSEVVEMYLLQTLKCVDIIMTIHILLERLPCIHMDAICEMFKPLYFCLGFIGWLRMLTAKQANIGWQIGHFSHVRLVKNVINHYRGVSKVQNIAFKSCPRNWNGFGAILVKQDIFADCFQYYGNRWILIIWGVFNWQILIDMN